MNTTSNPQSLRTSRTSRLALAAAATVLIALVLLLLLGSSLRPAQAECPDPPCISLPPYVTVDNPSVVVNEGQTATNTGTFEDPEEDGVLDTVSISASEGTVTKDGRNNGTWSWSLATTDVPADQTKTVTITATDSDGLHSTTSFTVTVKDVQVPPPPPPDCSQNENSTKIAYSGPDGTDAEIFMIDDSGGTPCQVTNNTMFDAHPSLSSDGKRIAFAARESGTDFEIYTVDASGGTPVQVTNNTRNDLDPSYSPDGTKIAYQGHDGTDSEIYTVDASGGTPVQVTNNTTSDQVPAYSPDGTKIAYAGSDGTDLEIYTIAATGGTRVPITSNTTKDFNPSYSPDGTKIAYDNCGDLVPEPPAGSPNPCEIYTIAATGGTPFNVTNNTLRDVNPAYSPDGTKIAYESREGTALPDIYTIAATGGTPFNVTNSSSFALEPSYPQPSKPADTTAPRVTSTVPKATATGVAPGANITATFSEAMDPKTLVTTPTDPANPNVGTSTTFKLMKAGTTNLIPAVVTYDPTTNKAILNPNANLRLGTKYKAAVTTGAKDLAVNQLDQDQDPTNGLQQMGWSFTVRN